MEYYVYGGFDPILKSLQRVALIFSDDNYLALFTVVAVMGIFFAGTAAFFSALSGKGSGGLFSWVLPILVGVMVFFGLVVPKDTIHLHDPIRQRYQPVPDLPQGIVFVMGTMNLIERSMVEILSVASDPVSYNEQAGGIGFDALANLSSKGILLSDPLTHKALREYIKDCVFFEIQRPGTTTNVRQLQKNESFLPIFEASVNPAVFTLYYGESEPSGKVMTCSESWPLLKAQITNPANFEESSKARCSESGFDVSIPSEFAQCKRSLTNLVNWLEGATYSSDRIFQQVLIAQEMNNVLQQASPDTTASVMAARDIGNSMTSSGVVANQWLPVIRAVLTAIIIGLIPFMALFIPTPLVGKVLGLLFGFLVWLCAWGVTDAVIHTVGMDYSRVVFEEIRQHQLGLVAISTFSTASLKTLAAFGALRWSGLALATVLTTALVKFGGSYAVSSMASGLTKAPQASANEAGRMMTPEGNASALSRFEGSVPTMSNAHRFGFEERTDAKTIAGAGEIMAMSGMSSSFGRNETARIISSGNTGRMITSGGEGMATQAVGLDKGLALSKGKGSMSLADTDVKMNQAGEYFGGSVNTQAQMNNAPSAATAQAHGGKPDSAVALAETGIRKGMGQQAGELVAFNSAKAGGFQGDWKDYNKFTSEIGSVRGFEDASALKAMSEKYFGGDMAKMSSATSAYRASQDASTVSTLSNRGLAPEVAGGELGRKKGLSETGDIEGLRLVGSDGIVGPARSAVTDRAASNDAAIDRAIMSGFMKDKKDNRGLASYQKASHSDGSIIATKASASRLQKALRAGGNENATVAAGDKITFAPNPDGNGISYAEIRGGANTTRYDYASDQSGWKNSSTALNETARGDSHQGAFQATMRGDYSQFAGVADQSINMKTKDGQEKFAAASLALVKGIVDESRVMGLVTGSSDGAASLNGSVGIGFSRLGSSASMSESSMQSESVYLDAAQLSQRVSEGRAKADGITGISDKQREDIIGRHVREGIAANYADTASKREGDYGKDKFATKAEDFTPQSRNILGVGNGGGS